MTKAPPRAEAGVDLARVLRWRAERHLLGRARGADVVEVARRLSGVHAQVAGSAAAATALRLTGAGPAEDALTRALTEDRTLVKTWAARGTLHYLPADDLPAWVAAMSTRTRETTGSWLKYHGVGKEDMAALHDALPEVLGKRPLTREQLTDAVVKASGRGHLREALSQGWGAVLKPAAFRGLLCFGPPKGRNVTFVAPRTWLPGPWPEVSTEDGIDTVLRGFLGTYGPAGPDEFARWFDLRPPLAKAAFARLAPELSYVDVDGVVGAVPAGLLTDLTRKSARPRLVRLLPAFDPYTVGSLRQLDTVAPGLPRAAVSRPQGWISPVLLVDGLIGGTHETTVTGDEAAVTVTATGTVDKALLDKAATDLAKAMGARTATVTVSG
jgi:hypothetical protein